MTYGLPQKIIHVFSILLFGLLLAPELVMGASFDATEANMLLEKLSSQLSDESPSTQNLKNATLQLIEKQKEAIRCVDQSSEALKDINLMMPQEDETPEDFTEDQIYLINKKKSLDQKLAQCRLFVLRADEAIQAINQEVQTIRTTLLFNRGPSITELLTQLPQRFAILKEQLSGKKLTQAFGLDKLSTTALVIFLILGLALLGFIPRLRRHLSEWVQTMDANPMLGRISQSLISSVRKHSLGLVLFTYSTLYLVLINLQNNAHDLLVLLSVLGLGFTILITFIDFLFAPPAPAQAFCQISDDYADKFSLSLKGLSFLILLGFYTLKVLTALEVVNEIIYLVRGLFFTLIALAVFGLLVMLNHMPKFLAQMKRMRAITSVVSLFILSIILMTDWMGYQGFSSYILEGVVLTLVASFLAWFLHHSTQTILSSFDENKYSWQKSFHYFLGVEKQGSLPEIVGLKVGLFILIWGSLFIALLNIWTIGQAWAYRISDSLSSSWTLPNTDISFVPSRLIVGFIAFSLLVILVRFLRALIQKNVRTSKDKAEREAYGAIFGYTGFAFALFFTLVIAGIDFKNLAIIAGALSVGIGFGLQNIVSNFISGIILLLERPIKPGDRISIGQEEGFVKKVSVRSTSITTLENIDVIIPNAELTSQKVINQTFNNLYWRVTVKVGVAYGSDVEAVKVCLYEVANSHPEVFNDGPNKPQVFFLEFGESSLNFEMWCIIKNVNLKLEVLSELNCSIAQIFEQRGITIPFPQRDLHIKDSHPISIDLNAEKPKDD